MAITTDVTVLDMINRALRILGVKADGETADSNQAIDSFKTLNTMIDNWVIDGMNVANFSNLTDVVTLAAGYVQALEYNLAIELLPEYPIVDDQMIQLIMKRAMESKASIQRHEFHIPEARVDSSLQRMSDITIYEVYGVGGSL